MSTEIAEWLDDAQGMADAATEGPWSFGQAPAEGSDETKAEYMQRALTDAGPLYALFVPSTVGHPDGYLVPAVTGDGPNARMNAAFIADARTRLPQAIAALRAVLEFVSDSDGDPRRHALADDLTAAIADALGVQP